MLFCSVIVSSGVGRCMGRPGGLTRVLEGSDLMALAERDGCDLLPPVTNVSCQAAFPSKFSLLESQNSASKMELWELGSDSDELASACNALVEALRRKVLGQVVLIVWADATAT